MVTCLDSCGIKHSCGLLYRANFEAIKQCRILPALSNNDTFKLLNKYSSPS